MAKTLKQRILEADHMGNRYIGDYNERIEAGKNDKTAERLYSKCQFWLDKYNKLTGNGA